MTPSSYQTLELDQTIQHVLIVYLNNPRTKNAFSWRMYFELGQVLSWVQQHESISVVVLTGKGEFYSSGNDLSNFALARSMGTKEMADRAEQVLIEFVDRFIDLNKVLIAAVNGPAIGIAATTLALADLVFCSEEAYISTPFAALAQTPEGCSSYLFPLIMGKSKAQQVLLAGKKLTAQDAF